MHKSIVLVGLAMLLTLACTDSNETPTSTLPQALQTEVADWETIDCDPSYPTVCIAPYPPDLDCADIPYRRFRVVPPDQHGFDRDMDGIGCEWD